MNKEDILKLAGELVLAGTTDNAEEIARISEELSRIVWSAYSKKEATAENGATSLNGEFTGFLKFTDKEISKMPKLFRHTFIAEGKVIFLSEAQARQALRRNHLRGALPSARL